ncbi:hypothetical protein DESUT3_23680 [Desulfuromonas versatilis]|uniref:Ice-binding protein C-terminal domain-containing protein n=1 Tax=Desulfuromonas versatilis TaxID=2802975 RepID=A0ABN6E1E7_9BACT|nr:choice-of-anchor N protein [Desulfuromonas versatilis]BCR05299.1 hypothetical protein DESUT3_23680 [Desulfuromonas versatilis]
MGPRFLCIFLVLISLSLFPRNSLAINTLQLDIGGGWYDPSHEDVKIENGVFTLFAILTPGTNNASKVDAYLDKTYYISSALVPKVSFGQDFNAHFTVDGKTINATEDMNWGNPPIENLDIVQPHDGKDLGPHDIFNTYFFEFEFQFNSDNKIVAYNTQSEPGANFDSSQTSLKNTAYYAAFQFDTTGLIGVDAGNDLLLHFDLYSKKPGNNGALDIDRDLFAPFSHDASTIAAPVPEPGSLLFFSAGLIGLGLFLRRRKFD